MIEPDHPELSIGQQCKLLSIARSLWRKVPPQNFSDYSSFMLFRIASVIGEVR